jgi:ABC-type cobalt transport system, ATPase component
MNTVAMSRISFQAGNNKRVAIAGIVSMLPECIVLYDPTAMLDPRGRKEVLDTCIKLNREMGMTVVFITHIMDEAVLADRVLVMPDAQIILDGTPKQVFPISELLIKVGLDVPETANLANDLRETGAPLPEDILSADALSGELFALLGTQLCPF